MKKIAAVFGLVAIGVLQSAGAYTITAEKYQPSAQSIPGIKGTLVNGAITSLYTSITYRQQTSPGILTPFDAWCIEPLVNDTAGPYTYEVSDLFGSAFSTSAVQSALERLWTVAESSTGAPTLSTDASLPANSSALSAAFQIALWELVSDGTGWSFDMGSVRLAALGTDAFTDSVRGLASGWLTTAFLLNDVGGYSTARTALEYLDTARNTEGRGQDHIRPKGPNDGGDDPIPLPGIAWLLGLGLVGFLRLKRQ